MVNLYLMKAGNGRPSNKSKKPPGSTWLETREANNEEHALGAACVMDRRDGEGVIHTVLIQDHGEHYSQFGAPMQIMKDNEEAASAWHRKLRDFRFKASHMVNRQKPYPGRQKKIV